MKKFSSGGRGNPLVSSALLHTPEADAQPGNSFSCPPLASAEQLRRLEKLVEGALAAGARLLYQARLPRELREAEALRSRPRTSP